MTHKAKNAVYITRFISTERGRLMNNTLDVALISSSQDGGLFYAELG